MKKLFAFLVVLAFACTPLELEDTVQQKAYEDSCGEWHIDENGCFYRICNGQVEEGGCID